MPNWIRDSGGRLVKLETPHNKELELSLNIMEATPEDQHSHHGHQDNPNAFRSMRDRMHPPRMSAPSCIVPPTEQLVIRPYCSTSTYFPWDGKQISNFSAKENEKFYECWERYMEAINACPHHGFDTWLLVSYFYDGMSSSMKQLLETMCGGDFMSKNPEEAMDFLSYVAEVSRDGMNRTKEKWGRRSLNQMPLMLRLGLQVKPCPICQSYEHLVEECPTIPTAREMFGDQANVIGQFKPNNNASYGNTYNSNWRNHPNFSGSQEHLSTQPAQASQQASNLEQAIVNLSKVVGDFVGDQNPSMLNSVKELTVAREGRFPSQPHQNPKGIHEVETHEGESSQVRDVKALITLRSGKKVELPTPKPHVEKKKKKRRGEEIKGKKKDSSEGKEDHDSTVNANPEKVLIKGDVMKKQHLHLFLKLCMGKREQNA
ncbi:hypothetical protein CK203_086294 [Vitis vinifera]|uniref:Retrotransposon gag domain-containing protein n=1 Tax=Vitis vinifera TaxID=29760 RepID=A0A438ED91_VITVI|nr:hypothetical protein CK203_086294 [Vitis vinifera]